MEKEIYDKEEKHQNTYWWFTGKRDIVLDVINHYCIMKPKSKVLDIGCCMGLMLKAYRDKLSCDVEVYGLDYERRAVEYCQCDWGKDKIVQGALPDNMPFPASCFDMISALDVLEHVEDDNQALTVINNLLTENGYLVVTVPAMKCLWGYNDIAVHHKRRYTKDELISKIEKSGFQIIMCSYYNFWLWVPIWGIRNIKNLLKIEKDDLSDSVQNGIFNRMLYKIFVTEKYGLRKKGYPFGVSLILIAIKAKGVI